MKEFLGVMLLALGCGGSDFQGSAAATPMGCTAGEQRECACPGGVKSVQVCDADGMRFDACACPDAGPDAGNGSSGTTGTGSGAGGGPPTCDPKDCPVYTHTVPKCTAGQCETDCEPSFIDCDGNPLNGCECGPLRVCVAGTCS